MLEVFLAVMSLIALTLLYLIIKEHRKRAPVAAATDVVTEEIAKQVVSELAEKLEGLKEYEKMVEQRISLESELAVLRRDVNEIEQTFKRKQLDLEHAAGLARLTLDAELEQGRVRAELGADRKVLKAEKEFNDKALAAQRKSFDEQMKRTQEITEQLFKLVPNIEARLRLKGDV